MNLALARSVVAALWIGHADARGDWLAPAVEAITGDDEPHRTDAGAPLAVLLQRFAEAAQTGPVLAGLPVPNEPVGASGPAGVAAMEAGECLLAHSGLVAVPDVVAFGSALEPGAMVQWATFSEPVRLPTLTLAEARSLLAETLVVAVDALERIDVARWRPEAADEIAALASSQIPPAIADVLPYDLDPRRRDLLVRSARLEAIADLALADDGASVTMWHADQRGAALRHVAGSARQAMSAATAFTPHR